MLLIFSLSTLAIAAIGFILCCWDNKCCAVLYGFILLPTWLTLIIIGAIATIIAVASEEALEDGCNDIDIDYNYEQGAYEVKIELEIYNSIKINDKMCSDFCPCKAGAYSSQWTLSNDDRRAATDYNFSGVGTEGIDWFASYEDCIMAGDNRPGAPAGSSPATQTEFIEFNEFNETWW